jgi:hypothetical protein
MEEELDSNGFGQLYLQGWIGGHEFHILKTNILNIPRQRNQMLRPIEGLPEESANRAWWVKQRHFYFQGLKVRGARGVNPYEQIAASRPML